MIGAGAGIVVSIAFDTVERVAAGAGSGAGTG
jgi:hypothetical protein